MKKLLTILLAAALLLMLFSCAKFVSNCTNSGSVI